MKKCTLFGVSPFLSDILDIIHANDARVAEIFLNMPEVKRERVIGFRERIVRLGYEIKVHESLEPFKPRNGFLYALGTPSPHKSNLVEELKQKYSITFDALIHPTVYLGSNVQVGEGVIVNVNSTIGPNAILNDFCVINRCASVGHDTKIGKHALVGPNAAIAGSVTIGDYANIAMMATVIERIHIGSWSVIGAGSIVTKDIPEHVIAYGVPAKIIRENEEKNFKKYKSNRSTID